MNDAAVVDTHSGEVVAVKPMTLRERLRDLRQRRPLLFYTIAGAVSLLIVRIVDGFMRRSCSTPMGLLDPLKAGNATCRLQQFTDVFAKAPERVVATLMPSRWVYSTELGHLVNVSTLQPIPALAVGTQAQIGYSAGFP